MTMSGSGDDAEKCPVDHKSREAWLKISQAQKNEESSGSIAAPLPVTTAAGPLSFPPTTDKLDTVREVSSIPRADGSSLNGGQHSSSSSPQASIPASLRTPANSEMESGTSKSGKWIYPSEKMFFDAMKRKQHDPQTADMHTIVPIHNAVNERAWKEIMAWEKGQGAESCGGPKLVSFSGMASALTPRARINTLLGYQPPFDRHDWIVDRCGQQIDYVIDFYIGRDEQRTGKPLNFYLDVRPKLNSWEGCKMRFLRAFWS